MSRIFQHAIPDSPTSSAKAPEDIAIEAWGLLEQDGTGQPSTDISSISPSLRLPRELRDMIYVYYARVDGGLFYDSHNDTMRVASGQVLDPSLALTCSQVACEMEGIAVKANTISFSTVYNEASSQRAEMFHYAMRDIAEEKSRVVNKMAPRLLTLDDAKEVALLYPQFQPILDR
jgi:hypothetical protein